MVLVPHDVGLRGAAGEPVRILDVRGVLLSRRHVLVAHPVGHRASVDPAVVGDPRSAARHADEHRVGITWVDRDGVDARPVVSAADPLGALGHVPQRPHEFPRIAAVDGPEQAAGDRAAPQLAGSVGVAVLERPQQLHGPRPRFLRHRRHVGSIGRAWRVRRCGDLGPRPTRLPAPHVRSEMARAECRVHGTVAIDHGRGHRFAEERHVGDRPRRPRPFQCEQPLARPHQQRSHHQPPESACITMISVSASTGSVWPATSTSCEPPTNTAT